MRVGFIKTFVFLYATVFAELNGIFYFDTVTYMIGQSWKREFSFCTCINQTKIS